MSELAEHLDWRNLLSRLSFPVLVGVLLLWGWVSYSARQDEAQRQLIAQKEAEAAQRQARYDAEHMAARVGVADVSNCDIRDWGYTPVDVDGDPHHAKQVLWTRLLCAEGSLTMRGKLPRLVTQR